jgi:hypothetical protein
MRVKCLTLEIYYHGEERIAQRQIYDYLTHHPFSDSEITHFFPIPFPSIGCTGVRTHGLILAR